MSLNNIEELLSQSGIKVCQICGTPFKPYHSRQKTCGDSECKRIYHINSVKRRTEKIRLENPEKYKEQRREYSRKARAKKKFLHRRETQLKGLEKHWEKQAEFDRKVSEYGHEYGKRSAEKVLSEVPKIDVSGFEKEISDGKNLCKEK